MTGWLLILTLLVLGGVLSNLGDRLGSRVGKARLSLFRLRPRSTAVLITVLTGSLISAISLGLMLLVSERLRTGLFELDQLEERLANSRRLLASSQLELNRAEQGKRDAQQRFEQAQARASKLRQELAPLIAQRNRLEQERSRLNLEVRDRDAEIGRTEAELSQVRKRIAAGAQELKDLESNLIALRRGDVVITSGQILSSAKVGPVAFGGGYNRLHTPLGPPSSPRSRRGLEWGGCNLHHTLLDRNPPSPPMPRRGL